MQPFRTRSWQAYFVALLLLLILPLQAGAAAAMRVCAEHPVSQPAHVEAVQAQLSSDCDNCHRDAHHAVVDQVDDPAHQHAQQTDGTGTPSCESCPLCALCTPAPVRSGTIAHAPPRFEPPSFTLGRYLSFIPPALQRPPALIG